MCADRVRFGVLGGTFDPVHLGHIASAREVAESFSLSRVLLVLSARPPHKTAGDAAPVEDRWRMLELAAADANAGGSGLVLEPCDVEMRRSGPSWTVDTLGELAAAHHDKDLFLVIGRDAYAEIDTWSRPAEILALASIIVTTRPGLPESAPGVHADPSPPLPPVAARADARYDPDIGVYVHTSGHTIHGQRIRGIEASSSEIRSRVRAGLPIEHLTGSAVARYIHEHRLYAVDRAPAQAGSTHKHAQGAGKD